MKESLAILKNCFPNGIPTIVIHHIQPTIRFPSAISQPKNTIHMRFTKNAYQSEKLLEQAEIPESYL